MLTVSISINGEPIYARTAVNISRIGKAKTCLYQLDTGAEVLHDPEDGAVALAQKMLDTIVEVGAPDGSLPRATEEPPPEVRNYEQAEELYEKAVALVRWMKAASTSLLQRKLNIGYVLSADLMELLEKRGVIGPKDGSRPRKVL